MVSNAGDRWVVKRKMKDMDVVAPSQLHLSFELPVKSRADRGSLPSFSGVATSNVLTFPSKGNQRSLKAAYQDLLKGAQKLKW